MATQTLSILPSSSTAANFNNWGKQISDALTLFGITKTNDTGQVDWNTNTYFPTTANPYQAYEIRQLTDNLQTIKPVYFKIEYGPFNANLPTTPGLRLTFGSVTNGAGVVSHTSNNTNISLLKTGGSGANSIPVTCLLSGSSNRLQIAWLTDNTTSIYLSIERTKTILGVDTDLGLLISTYNGDSTKFKNNSFPFIGAIPLQEQSGIFVPSVGTGNDNTILNIYPNTFFKGGTPILGTGSLGYFNSDVTAGVNTLNILGSNHQYYFLSHPGISLSARGNIAGTGLAMLFE